MKFTVKLTIYELCMLFGLSALMFFFVNPALAEPEIIGGLILIAVLRLKAMPLPKFGRRN